MGAVVGDFQASDNIHFPNQDGTVFMSEPVVLRGDPEAVVALCPAVFHLLL